MTAGHALLIRGGLVLSAGGPVAADVLVRDGVVAEIGPAVDAGGGAVQIDAAGCWVGPGFVDLHTHLREPGQEHKEDIASGSAAAAAGGYTAIVAMPNTSPAMDSSAVVNFVAGRGRQVGLVEVVPSGTISVGRRGETLAPIDELWAAGVRIFTDDGDAVADAGLLRDAMAMLASRGGVIFQHAVDPGLSAGAAMHDGEVAARLGVRGVPAIAEEIVIQRDVALMRLTGARYHVQHVSTQGAVAVVAAAKEEGLPLTAEVTPHHLSFDESELNERNTMYKMMPPLRTPDDVAALRSALAAGVIDVVATDHAPHTASEKDTTLEAAPPGVTGLEWAAAVVNTTVGLGIAGFFDRMSEAPARIAGLSGHHGRVIENGMPANLVVFDPVATWVPTTTRSKSTNSPYLGRTLKGMVRRTVYRGTATYNGEDAP